MDPKDLRVNDYYGYSEPPYGYMMVKYLGKNAMGRYVFSVEMPKGTRIELTEQQVRGMVIPA